MPHFYLKSLSLSFILISAAYFWHIEPISATVVVSSSNLSITNKNNVTDGLVGWWTFDGSKMNQTTAFDTSPNGYNATLTGMSAATATAVGKIGQALTFRGAQYLSLANGTIFFAETDPFSGTAWIKTSTTSVQSIISNHTNGTNPGWNFAISKTVAGKLSFCLCRSSQTQGRQKSTTASVNDGQWHHVAFTYSGSQTTAGILLYIDGVLATTADDFSQPPNTFVDGSAAIASRRGTTPTFFTGLMDDVRVYNRVLTATEIRQIYGYASTTIGVSSDTNLSALPSGTLRGWWGFDGNNLTSATATDQSGSGNNGSLQNVTRTTGNTPGVVGGAMKFNGTNQYIRIASSTSLAGTGSHTLIAWAKPNTTSGTSSIVMKNSVGTGMFLYGLNGNWTTYAVTTGGRFVAQETDGLMTAGKWAFLASVYNASNNLLSLYVDGTLVATTSVTGSSLATTAGSSSIAADMRSGTPADYFNGSIDGVRIYSKALTDKEIYNLSGLGNTKLAYASPQNMGAVVTQVPYGLIGYWTFDGKNVNSTTAFDSTRNAYNGTLNGTPTPTPGKLGQAFSFNGSSGYIDIGSGDFPFTLGTPFSGAAWIRTNTATRQHIIANHNNGTSAGWTFGSGNVSGRLNFSLVNAGETAGRIVEGNTTISDGGWHHVVFTYDGSDTASGIQLYVDGIPQSETITTNTSSGALTDTSTRIGTRSGTGLTYWNGSIDDVRLYNRVLSSTEALTLYKAGAR